MSKYFLILILLSSGTNLRSHFVQKRDLYVHLCPNQEQYPWIVSIQRDNSHKCNGIILDDRNILTTAYCCENILNCNPIGPNPHVTVLYTYDITESFPTVEHCQFIGVDRCITHDFYRRKNFTVQYDIAIVKLARRLVPPVHLPLYYHKLAPLYDECLYDGDYEGICKNADVVGRWLHHKQEQPTAAFECFRVTIRTMKSCHEVSKCVFLRTQEDRTLTCSYDASNRFEVCSAFYGAPLMCDRRVSGLVSHKFNLSEQCEEVSPFYYSRIDYAIDFIKNHTDKFRVFYLDEQGQDNETEALRKTKAGDSGSIRCYVGFIPLMTPLFHVFEAVRVLVSVVK